MVKGRRAVDFAIFVLIFVGLVLLGWYAQRRELFENNMDEEANAFKSRLSLLEGSRDKDAEATSIEKASVEGGVAGSEVYSFVANYCS